MATVSWAKQKGDTVSGTAGPFVAKLEKKGDGRWNWWIYADGAEAHLASGVSASVGQARTKCEQFIERSGRV